MVARDLRKLAAVQKIGTRVANLRYDELVSFEHGGRAGRAHALAAFARECGCDDVAVRLFDCLAEFFGVGMFRGALRDGLDADFGCNLAGSMATHAVGDDEQRGSHDERILVLLADAADVGAAAELGNRTCTRAFSGTI